MTFDPTPEQQAIVDRARSVARRIRSVAATIDKAGRVPEELTQLLLEMRNAPRAGLDRQRLAPS